MCPGGITQGAYGSRPKLIQEHTPFRTVALLDHDDTDENASDNNDQNEYQIEGSSSLDVLSLIYIFWLFPVTYSKVKTKLIAPNSTPMYHLQWKFKLRLYPWEIEVVQVKIWMLIRE